MIFDIFRNFTSNYSWLLDFAAVLALFLLFFKKVRGLFVVTYKWIKMFFAFPFKGGALLEQISVRLSSLETSSASAAKDIGDLKELVGYNGGSGLMDSVGFIMGFQSNEFWMRSQPGFICDASGRNVDCTHGYCRLLGLASKEDLIGNHWKSYADQREIDKFLEDFKGSAATRESFRRQIRLYDVSGKDLGYWVVVASPISSEKAKTARYIGFLYPFGDNAIEIAEGLDILAAPPI